MIDFEEIRKQIAIKHNVLLDKDDPILVTITINEIVLSRYLDLVTERYSDASRDLTIALLHQQEESKRIAEKIITEASDYVSNQVRQSVEESILEAGKNLKQQSLGNNIASSNYYAQKAEKKATLATIMAVVSTVVAVVALVVVALN
ncbi:conjugal transfer protein TraM [Nitrosomonas europaea]|uniref:conjugal transfer protein TraM n=1 Tax=Nitrosomonas europaea TaxID=915 RepID=UPI00079B02BC|nr:conjugal transfer protein TraM [Nitrosomonas europaea]KXK48100.1 MAG: Transcriptional activator TraM [Nitrosomonas europaea]